MSPQHIYVDASGNPDLEHLTDTTHYIIAAVMIDDAAVEASTQAFEAVRKNYFQASPIKSLNVGDNHSRRREILEALVAIDFHAAVFVVDKRAIQKDSGLKFKESFFKFLHKLLFRRLFRAFNQISMKIDSYGRDEFKESFKRYADKQFEGLLFPDSTTEFVKSTSCVPVQVADFVAGSLMRYYDGVKGCEQGKDFVGLLGPKIIYLDEFPIQYRPDLSIKGVDSEVDATVRNTCWHLATRYLSENPEPYDDAAKARVAILTKLLNTFSYVNDRQWLSRPALMDCLSFLPDKNRNEHFFKSDIIAPLRDAGVIIASSMQGYKIPAGAADLEAFVDQIDRVVAPMIKRLDGARKSINLATKNQLDILQDERFSYLRELLKTLK